ncbi:hypothetical protein OFN56_05160, partial [Escherichia coli]|nr:hypothetical protein [Escherichia coli]
ADINRSHWSTSKTPSYTKSVSWQHHLPRSSTFWLPSTVSSFTTPITLVVKAAIPGGAYIKADINKESTERRQ